MLQKSAKIEFSNSLPWLLLILTIFPMLQSFTLFNHVHKFLNTSKVSDFSLMKSTQVKREKSSTHTNTYLFLAMLSTYIGPIRSMWSNSRTRVVEICCNTLCNIFFCFLTWHGPQTLVDSCFNLGIPLTTPILAIFLRFL